ncbi:DUF4834 domain-containing protein [Flavobacteriaceae bacterium KMM 6897]|nr:DUF4834 domain-containing protein [Flavobacteriaceae bacterium KMM 6897]MEB8345585.1 DUF4834 domain-containing protein [Flavobacteriaceae bacterium KMM 6898]
MGLLRTVLIILLVYFFLKILAKWFGPRILRYAAKKTEQHFKEKFGGFPKQPSPEEEKEGEVIIEKKEGTSSTSSNKVGEYIDFEEID